MKSEKYGEDNGEFVEHQASHTDFIGKLASLNTPLSTEMINYAKDWYASVFMFLLLSQTFFHSVWRILYSGKL